MQTGTALNRDRMLGEEKIGRLLARLAIPAIIGTLVFSLYNLVDTIFVGQGIGALAIGALAVVFPLQTLLMAAGAMLGIGAASVISRNLGAGNREQAYMAAGNALVFAAILGLAILIPCEIFIYQVLNLFGATGELLSYAYDYLVIILWGSVFTTFALAGNSIIRSEGRAAAAMLSLMLGTGLNIPLDYLLIFVFDMGIRGAALATVIAQSCSFLYVLFFFITGRSSLKITFRHLIPNLKIIREILVLGIPVFIRQGAKSVLFIIVNNSLKYYGNAMSIPVFGIIFRLFAFLLLPAMGIGEGFQPIAGFNYGAKQYDRVREAVWKAVTAASVLAIAAFTAIMLFPEFLIGLFSNDARLIKEAVSALRLFMLAVPLVGLQIIGSLYFFAIGKALPALLLGLSRQVLLLIPFVLILPIFWKITGIWGAFPLADIFSTGITGFWLMRELILKKKEAVHAPLPVS